MTSTHAPTYDSRYADLRGDLVTELGRGPGAVIVLTGGVGAGKSTLMSDVLTAFPEAESIRVRGSRFGSSTPYFALSHILGDAVSRESSTAVASAALRDHLRAYGNERVIIAVTNWELLDRASIDVIVSACATGHYRALIGSVGLAVDLDLLTMVNTQIARHVELPPLDVARVTTLMEASCPGIVTRQVAEAIVAVTAGDPLLVNLVLEQGIAGGWYVERSGAWVLGENSPWNLELGGPGVRSLLASLSEEAHSLLELLSVLGGVTTDVLVDLYRLTTIAELEARGLIRACTDGRRYHMSAPILGKVVRSSLSDGRFRAVWDLYADLVRGPGHRFEPGQLLRAAQCGIEVDPAAIFDAAARATSERDHRLSDTLLDLVELRTAFTEYFRSVNARLRGDSSTAWTLAESSFALADDDYLQVLALSSMFTTDLELTHRMDSARAVLVRMSAISGDVDSLLAGVLAQQRRNSAQELTLMCHFLLWAYDWEMERFTREYERISSVLQSGSMRATIGSIYAEFLAVRGDQERARATIAAINVDATIAALPSRAPEVVTAAQSRVWFITGEWAASLGRLRPATAENVETSDVRRGYTELSAAAIASLRGESESARRSAIAAFVHLSAIGARDPELRGALFTATTGQRWSPIGYDPAPVSLADLLRVLEVLDTTGLPEGEVLAPRIAVLRLIVDLQEPALALELLGARIGREREAGRHGVALLLCLLLFRVLIRHGDTAAIETAQRVAAVASVRETVAHTTGGLSQTLKMFLQLIDSPLGVGRAALTDRVERLGLGSLLPLAEPAPAVSLLRRATENVAGSRPAAAVRESPQLEQLSGREWDTYIALSEGLSNTEIAASFGVSVRTAEGHVQKLYRLLGVSSRRALQERFPRGVLSRGKGEI